MSHAKFLETMQFQENSNILTMDHIKAGLTDPSASVRARASMHPLMSIADGSNKPLH